MCKLEWNRKFRMHLELKNEQNDEQITNNLLTGP